MKNKKTALATAITIITSTTATQAENYIIDQGSTYQITGGIFKPASPSNNTITINNVYTSFGYTGGFGGSPTNNILTINNSNTGLAVGGSSDNNPQSTIIGNTVIINGGSVHLGQGGSGTQSIVKNNTLILNSATNDYRVMGALGSTLENNKIIITNSKVGEVFGGQLYYPQPGSYSLNNDVDLRGTTTVSGDVYGGVLNTPSGGVNESYQYSVVKGNTLTIAPTSQTITIGGTTGNFEEIFFDFSDFDHLQGGSLSAASGGLYALHTNEILLYPDNVIVNFSIKGISGEFGRLNLVKSTLPFNFVGDINSNINEINSDINKYDFLTFNTLLDNDGTVAAGTSNLLSVSYGLNWYFNDQLAHGNFTLDAGDTYYLATQLNDRNPVPINTAGWDGKSLTKYGQGTLVLKEDNTYTGLTTIEAGTLQLGDSEAVGSIAAASNVTINNGGVLAINRSDNFSLDNAITGAGAVTQMGTGQLLLTANNTYSGGTNVTAGSLAITNTSALGSGEVRNSATVLFDNAQGNFTNTISGTGDVSFSNGSDVRLLAGLTASDITIDAGSSATIASTNPFAGVITNNGILAVDLASNYVLDGPISGSGVLNQQGTGQLLLTQANSYSGGTNINAGTLAINNIGAVGSGAVNNAGTFAFIGASGAFANPISGAGNVHFADNSNIDITGALTASMTTVDAGSRASVAAGQQWNSPVTNAGTLDLGENSTLNGAVTNSGQLSMEGSAVQATVIGNVINAGQIRLDDDNSVGSLLTINGDYVGNNGVLVINTQVGDDNSPTDLLKISGAASGQSELLLRNIGGQGDEALRGIRIIETGSSTHDAFALRGGHVAAGAYDYTLLRRSETDGDNWYLHNGFDIDGDGEPDPEAGPTYTPGLGSVIANTIASNALFSMRFEDREGAGQSQLGAKTQDNLWVRYSGGNNKFRALNNQLHTSGHSSALQIGVGLPSLLESHSIDFGLMAGYGHYKGNTKSSRTERKSSSVVDGYSVGLYGTWYSDPASQSGVYVDSWLLWNHFNNRITGADENKYRYKSKGVTASVEVGKGYAIGELNGADIWMQPQAQVIYQGVRANKVTDAQDVTAKRGSANVQLRTGVKTYADDIMLGNMSSRPFVEINYIHNTDHYSVKIDDSTYRAAGGKNIGEIRLGLEGNVLGSHQMWINTGYADGGKHYQDFSIQAGWKYQF